MANAMRAALAHAGIDFPLTFHHLRKALRVALNISLVKDRGVSSPVVSDTCVLRKIDLVFRRLNQRAPLERHPRFYW